MNFDLIIFDCDGVLVDSEVISCRAHAEMLSRHGYPITQEQVFDRFLGRSTRQANAEVEAELGRALPDDFHVQMQAEQLRSFEADLEAIPHIRLGSRFDHPADLRSLERIARSECASRLSRTRLYDRFAPQHFLRLAGRQRKARARFISLRRQQMNVAPERCLVIEDSVPGVTGGRVAGMAVLGFHGGSHCRPDYGDGAARGWSRRCLRRYAAIASYLIAGRWAKLRPGMRLIAGFSAA